MFATRVNGIIVLAWSRNNGVSMWIIILLFLLIVLEIFWAGYLRQIDVCKFDSNFKDIEA